MNSDRNMGHLCWDRATGMPSETVGQDSAPQGALVPDNLKDCDQVAVVYNKGDTPPEITIRDVSGSVQTVLADGVAVAVIASAAGRALSPDDVLLVERAV
ncbi:hypothetical protein Z945_2325 [Sulfitobacter noctilucae]|uniref:hypothetical protein n=1 Tax=Sulfitobacter noctilucae TaxID=1342302 RepID=UPI0004688C04|nr:hypothetical protein [Sulfitobacter noctilucae]KIN61333.1 hypothetical protein Z945_2325 [Sulfitobacter noctilucae]